MPITPYNGYSGPLLLSPEFTTTNFDCGKPALNLWLVRHAWSNQQMNTSRTWVILDGGGTIIAYYASATASILRTQATGRLARQQPDQIPAILLGRLAVDQKHQHQGLGAALLKHCITKSIEVSDSVGVRLLLVHAKDEDARDFYLHYEFEQSPIDELTLMLALPGTLGH